MVSALLGADMGGHTLVIGALSVWLTFAGPAGAEAKHLDIEGDQPRDRITITVNDASLSTVLNELQLRYGFEVVGPGYLSTLDPMSMKVTGSLDAVLERLLRNRNYVVVHSTHNKSGIEKVIILDASYGTAPDATTQRGLVTSAGSVAQASPSGPNTSDTYSEFPDNVFPH